MVNGVQFNERSGIDSDIYEDSSEGLEGKLMNLSGGLIKTQKQSQYILVSFALMMIIISLFLFFSSDDEYLADESTVIPAEYGY